MIEREDDGGPIADQLERGGVIDSGPLFSAMTLIDGNHGALKRGEYAFKAGINMREVEQELLSGKVLLHSVTVPEGLTSEQIVQRLRDNDVLVGEVKELPREGSLLPETYKFARGETRQALLTVMAKAQQKAVDEIWKKRAPDLPIKSPGELVTLASIVEKETGKVEERPRVAGVFVNRLLKHMKLQSDPTIVYGLVFGKGTLGHSITKAELEQATPYNTYNIEGLPPGTDLQSRQGGARGGGESGPFERALFRRGRQRRPCFRGNARSAPEERRALATDRKGRQGQARARSRAAGLRAADDARRYRSGRSRRVRRAGAGFAVAADQPAGSQGLRSVGARRIGGRRSSEEPEDVRRLGARRHADAGGPGRAARHQAGQARGFLGEARSAVQ